MIKSLFDETEEQTQDKIEETTQPETPIEYGTLPNETDLIERLPANEAETGNLIETQPIVDLNDKRETEILQDVDDIAPSMDDNLPNVTFTLSSPFEPTGATEMPRKEADEPPLFQMQSKPESTAETARKSGLAMSAAIALFGSVVFLLIIGWFADLLLGTSPWGIIGGIVLGSIIGFFQFFRMTSQILKNKD